MKLSIRLALLLEEFIDADATTCAQHFRGLYLDADFVASVERVRLGRLAAMRWRLAHDFLWLLQSDSKRLPPKSPPKFLIQELIT